MRSYNNLGISDAFHPLSHHQNNPEKIAKLVKVQNFHTKVFTTFLDQLAKTPDGDGSLLDHSIILFGSNMSNSDVHNNVPLPSAVFGKAYGRIKGGQHIALPVGTPLANLHVTLLDRARCPSRGWLTVPADYGGLSAMRAVLFTALATLPVARWLCRGDPGRP